MASVAHRLPPERQYGGTVPGTIDGGHAAPGDQAGSTTAPPMVGGSEAVTLSTLAIDGAPGLGTVIGYVPSQDAVLRAGREGAAGG